MNSVNVGDHIASFRKSKGWTQARLAEESGLSASAIAMYETNRRNPDAKALEKLSMALGVTLSAVPASEHTVSSNDPVSAAAFTPLNQMVPVHHSADATAVMPPVPHGIDGAGGASTGHPVPTTDVAQISSAAPLASQGIAEASSGAPFAGLGSRETHQEAPSGYTNLALTRDEARFILFLRMNPRAKSFLDTYIIADESKRQQLEKTWRLIQDFQP